MLLEKNLLLLQPLTHRGCRRDTSSHPWGLAPRVTPGSPAPVPDCCSAWGPHCLQGHPLPILHHTCAPHHEKVQSRPPMVTETLLPALRWLPSMAIQVPPERGPRAGTTREKVGVCQRRRASLGSDGAGTETHIPKQPPAGDGAAEERDLWDSGRAQCDRLAVPAGLQGGRAMVALQKRSQHDPTTAQSIPACPPGNDA